MKSSKESDIYFVNEAEVVDNELSVYKQIKQEILWFVNYARNIETGSQLDLGIGIVINALSNDITKMEIELEKLHSIEKVRIKENEEDTPKMTFEEIKRN